MINTQLKTSKKAISTVLCALLIAGFISCKDNNGPTDNDNPCPECDTCLLITDINNPPVITEPTCIKFDDAITKIPDRLYNFFCSLEQGNITGICGKNIDSIGDGAFTRNRIELLCLQSTKYIGAGAFSANQLSTLDLPNTVYIGAGAFVQNHLTTLILSSIAYIGTFAFTSNPDLIEIHIYTDPALLELGYDILENTNTITIYIKNPSWKKAMEEKFKGYNVAVKVL